MNRIEIQWKVALCGTLYINVYLLTKQVVGSFLHKRQNCAKQFEGLVEITSQIIWCFTQAKNR